MAFTPPTGYTDISGAQATNANFYFGADKAQAVAGATGNAVGTFDSAISGAYTLLIALAAIPDVPPPSGDVILINFGPVDQEAEAVLTTDEAVESDDCFLGAFRYRLVDQAMRIAVDDTIVANNVGLGFNADGALVVTQDTGTATSFYNGLACIDGRLKVAEDTPDVHVHGWPVLNDGTVCVTDGGTPPVVATYRITSGGSFRITSGGDNRIIAP